ncbi:PREDICTED: LOW QUALITY PROTEIN: RIB43A-like with coiled-coils protein 2 [Galeopterus variegatus]|uniref:LOW QUALITY PROTEIN: RIB43A-like with coiled-coils protein 2 n=1 Tax=Galeopterus variegatus TaxID=482537 RepID=A0ABM0S5I7_GALVR|nr:PREDICTED: LOW QUALITY PROTEIN: RIB43A-like with coiled-coils protein 2 [Galeopterus variegatus]
MRQNDKIMCVLEDQERRDKKNLCRVINDFQQSLQKSETRREFDLVLKKDLPARQSDNDIQNTISGMQKFMGEDLNFHERVLCTCGKALLAGTLGLIESCLLSEDFHTETRLQFDETARHLQKLESATRKPVCAAVKEFNKNQAMEAAEKKKRERKQEQEDNLAEISNLLHGDLLSENPQQAASSFGPHRVVPNRWKGMTQEQLEQIRLVQKQQVQEKLRLQEEERQRDMDCDQRRVQSAHATLLFEWQQQCWQRDLSRALDSSNLSLDKEQQLQKKYMNEVYANQPTEEYFTQINTRSQ